MHAYKNVHDFMNMYACNDHHELDNSVDFIIIYNMILLTGINVRYTQTNILA